jgi:hypothetical protein
MRVSAAVPTPKSFLFNSRESLALFANLPQDSGIESANPLYLPLLPPDHRETGSD